MGCSASHTITNSGILLISYIKMANNYLKWSVKTKENQFGEYQVVSINKKEFNDIQDKDGYVSFMMFPKKDGVDAYGNSHTMMCFPEEAKAASNDEGEDLPF